MDNITFKGTDCLQNREGRIRRIETSPEIDINKINRLQQIKANGIIIVDHAIIDKGRKYVALSTKKGDRIVINQNKKRIELIIANLRQHAKTGILRWEITRSLKSKNDKITEDLKAALTNLLNESERWRKKTILIR